jgi:dolichol-phosphate mannosyltransferase
MKVEKKIAVVIPCFKVRANILQLLQKIGSDVNKIYLIDDKCPEGSGNYAIENFIDPRVSLILRVENGGVGAAVTDGYHAALKDGFDIVIKLDGDGQMDPALIPFFVGPLINDQADYTKGNRFYYMDGLKKMPITRLIGNGLLSFITKFSSGYWDIFDPTNGYTAIRTEVLQKINLDKVSKSYFFESDMLFRLNLVGAVVKDVPMDAVYADEVSNLKISHIFIEFLSKNLKNMFKRILYKYYVRDMSIASLELIAGIILVIFGVSFGASKWIQSHYSNIPSTAGTVMLAGICVILGVQFMLSFLAYDIYSTPKK